jgi:DNA-binding transcriptional regulator YiaG
MKTDPSMSDTQRIPVRSYPRPCGECGEISVQPATIAYEARVKHDGKSYEFPVASLNVDRCGNCQQLYFTQETDDQISAGLRAKVGLLSPEEIRQQLERLKLTQREFAEHLTVSQESVSRWLTGTNIQSRSLDTLMRLYFRFANVRNELTLRTPVSLDNNLVSYPFPVSTSGDYGTGSTTILEHERSGKYKVWSQDQFPDEVDQRSLLFSLTG